MKKTVFSAIIGLVLGIMFVAGLAQAEPKFRGTSEALYPAGTPVVQVFDNSSTVGATEQLPSGFLPDQGSWQIVKFGNLSTYTVVIEGSLVSASGPYEEMSKITESNTINLRHYSFKPVPFTQIRIDAMTGFGAIDAYIIQRGN